VAAPGVAETLFDLHSGAALMIFTAVHVVSFFSKQARESKYLVENIAD